MQPESPYQPPASLEPSFIQPVGPSAQLTLKQILFSFDGRIPRRTFWLWWLVTMFCVLLPVSLLAPLMNQGGALEAVAWIIMIPCAIVLFWTSLAVQVKRWHDLDKSGWWILIGMIPYVGGLIAFVFTGCIRGTDGPNRFGEDPT